MPCLRQRASEVSSKRIVHETFSATAPLEFVAIEFLGPLNPAAQGGNKFVLVITDRFSKLKRAVPMQNITALKVAKEFFQHWIYA